MAQLTWDAVAERISAGAAAILPIGAGAKEHGLHLPMNTDLIQAEWAADVIATEFDALIWPVLTYGYYPAFVRYAGSLSLSEATFRSVLADLIGGLQAQKVRKILVVNTGISTIPPAEAVVKAVVPSGQAHHLRLYDGPRLRSTRKELSEQSYGSHADEMETSSMLALAPQLVRMQRAQASPDKGPFPGPLEPDDASSPAYSPSGSYGDPTLATPEKGERLIAAMRLDMIDMARDALQPGS
ncbi:MAG: creatininase family protein [Pseudomonadota bacterium]|nr:creatininase family protein [Pseudomonadota bacterium]